MRATVDNTVSPSYHRPIMASERTQRRIEILLDQAEEAITDEAWQTVSSRARSVLALDPGNVDAANFLAAADRAVGGTASTAPTMQPSAEPPTASAPDAERRQLTVMFCDLQGSTALSQQLDPEVLRDVIRSYQEVCAGAVGRFEGHIAKYLGDGLLVYFGYPQAHEDDPQRAVRAGLAILQDMDALNARLKSDKDLELTVRIGIHTGLVVAGEMGGGDTIEELAIVGETPNIAARIEGAAPPNGVAISDVTANLVQGFFICETMGPHDLKGIAEPVELFRVLEESGALTRFEVATAAELTPLVGREQELGLLLDRWEQVEEGLGQVVLVSGEAGIGKSRLIDAVGERLAEKAQIRWRLRCSAYHQTSTLHPLIEFLEMRLGFQRDDSLEEKLAKLEDVSATFDEAQLLASVLSLPVDGRYSPLQLSPESQKERTKEILARLLMETDTGQPVLLVVEDLHWADPTTLEFLTFLVDQAPTSKLLALLTFRPEYSQPWGSRAHLSQITLNRLPRRLANDMLAALTGGKEFPEEIVTQIATKSDGVPLFVEELTRMVIESGLVLEEDGHYVLSGPLPALAIPSTLQDSLTARLDRLSSVKESIQLAAVLGREFSHELIRAVSRLDDPALVQHLEKLVAGEFLYQRGIPPDARYTFKHSLIQDAAYNSLLISRRQQYHQQTAYTLSEQFAETADAQPELLAHHYFEAGLTGEAVSNWLRAGEQSLSRYAWEEALAHFERGLVARTVSLDAEGEAAADDEVAELLFGRGRAQAATPGQNSEEDPVASFRRAFDHYEQVGNVPLAVEIAGYSLGVRAPAAMGELLKKALAMVPPTSHETGRLLSRYGVTLGRFTDDYDSCQEVLDRALVIARRENDESLEMRVLSDGAAMAYNHLREEECIKKSLAAIELAQRNNDPQAEITAHYYAAGGNYVLGNSQESERHAEAGLFLAEKLDDYGLITSALWRSSLVSHLHGDLAKAREFSDLRSGFMSQTPTIWCTTVLLEYETGETSKDHLERLQLAMEKASPTTTESAFTAAVILLVARMTGDVAPLDSAKRVAKMVVENAAAPMTVLSARVALGLIAVLRSEAESANEQHSFLQVIKGKALPAFLVSGDRILGLLAQTAGNIDQSKEHFEDGLAFCRKAAYKPELAWTCCDYADMLTERQLDGDRAKATALLDESLAISAELGMPPLMERVRSRLDALSA